MESRKAFQRRVSLSGQQGEGKWSEKAAGFSREQAGRQRRLNGKTNSPISLGEGVLTESVLERWFGPGLFGYQPQFWAQSFHS